MVMQARMALACLGLMFLSSCVDRFVLPEPPNLYSVGTNFPADQVPQGLRTTEPSLFFVTDRAPEGDGYGRERSASMAFGEARVRFGDGLTWDELVLRTQFDTTRRIERLRLTDLTELVRFPRTPLFYERKDGALRHVEEAKAAYDAQTRAFQERLRQEIAATGNSRLLIYVHGFNNDIQDSLTTLANLWHFTGRQTTPIAFTWPAGAGAGVLGYFRDRDAGTFSVYHMREFLKMLAEMPEVSQIDIVAHSRGTDVVATALRERILEARGAGTHPKRALKTGTLIMAAPDLDVDIVRQRLAADRFSEAFEQINLYINPGDFALRLSALLTQSTRVGALRPEDFLPNEIDVLRNEALVHFIRVEDVRGNFGHSYFQDNPAVLSDIVLALRTRAFPGGTLRPLEEGASGIWVLHPNYPLERLPDLRQLQREEARDAR